MGLTLTDWQRLYRLCDPKERLHFDELELFVERPDSVARKIASSLRRGFDAQGKWIICGSVGTGKSTELTKLAQIAWNDAMVIGVDLWQASARIDEISAAEILFCIGMAATRVASDRYGHRVSPERIKQLESAFAGLLDQRHGIQITDLVEGVALLGFDLLAPGSSKAAKSGLQALRATTGSPELPLGTAKMGGAKLGGLTRPLKEGDPAYELLAYAVDSILDEVRSIREPLILVDGLDKLTKIEAIRELFATSRMLARPRAPLVYTGPVTLMLAAEWSAASNYFDRARLTNLVVNPPTSPTRHAPAELVEQGRAAARGVIARRCEAARVALDAAFTGDALEFIITKSGGLNRQLLNLVREATKQAGMDERDVIDLDLARRACNEWGKEFEITMTGARREELEYIQQHGEPSGGAVSHELMLWNYAVPYANGELWFAPNPVIDLDRHRAP